MKRLWLYCFMAVTAHLSAGGGNDLDAASFVKLLPERFEAIDNYWMVDDYLFFTDKAASGGPTPSDAAPPPGLYAFDIQNKKIIPASIPNSLKIARIVRADLLRGAAKDSAEYWFESFIDKIMAGFEQDGAAQRPVRLPNEDKQILRRYLQLRHDGKEDGRIELDDCLAELAGLYSEIAQKKRALLDDFQNKWSVRPDGILFDDGKKPDFSAAPSALKKAEAISGYYLGKSENVAFWIKCYNLIIEQYKELKSDVSRSYEELLQEGFSIALKRLDDLREDNQREFEEGVEAYKKDLSELDDPFRDKIRTNLQSVLWSSIQSSDGIDYDFFSLDDARYAAIYNNGVGADAASESIKIFYGKGFEIFRCGVIDSYIFFCVDNAVVLYDALKLNEHAKITGREQALFAVDPDDPVFIMKTNKGYGIKRLTRNKNEYVFKE